jgi:hypothetical protein
MNTRIYELFFGDDADEARLFLCDLLKACGSGTWQLHDHYFLANFEDEVSNDAICNLACALERTTDEDNAPYLLTTEQFFHFCKHHAVAFDWSDCYFSRISTSIPSKTTRKMKRLPVT